MVNLTLPEIVRVNLWEFITNIWYFILEELTVWTNLKKTQTIVRKPCWSTTVSSPWHSFCWQHWQIQCIVTVRLVFLLLLGAVHFFRITAEPSLTQIQYLNTISNYCDQVGRKHYVNSMTLWFEIYILLLVVIWFWGLFGNNRPSFIEKFQNIWNSFNDQRDRYWNILLIILLIILLRVSVKQGFLDQFYLWSFIGSKKP